MLSSIRGRLLGGFLVCALFSSIAGVVGLFSVAWLGDSVARVVQEQLPVFDAAQDAAFSARGARVEVEQFLRSTEGLMPIRQRVEQALSLVDLYIAMIRDGSAAALAADPKRAAVAKAGKVDVVIQNSATGGILDQAIVAQSRFQEVVKAANAAMQAHEAWTKMMTHHEGRQMELDKFLYIQRIALFRWVADLEEAARFGTPVKGGVDHGASDFARWFAGFRNDDAKLTELLGAYANLHVQLYDLAKQIESAPAEQRLSLVERARTRIIARSGVALVAAIDYLTPVMGELRAQASRLAEEMNRVEGGLVVALDQLRKLVDADVGEAKAETVSIEDWSFRISASAAAFGLLASIACAVWIGQGITGPIGDLTGTMGRLANGELATNVPRQDRRDEIGVMARSVEIFRKGLNDTEMLRAETRQAQDAAALRAQQIMALVQEMEGVVLRTAAEITDASSALRQTAEGATVSASQAGAQSEAATEASQTARNKAQSVAAATEELSGSIVEIGRQASLSASISDSAAAELREAEQRVVRLSEAADRIGDVLNLINQIAGQTNLLALNATIEAARAGEAGKGFAVVAAEVKALAQQTARATNEISGHIAAIQAETKGTATAMRSVGGVIERAQESTVTIASAVEQQQAATNEIANNIQAVSTNSVTVEESCLETNRRIVDLLTNNAAVKDSADRLTVSAQGLRTEMDRFFERFRA